MLQLITCNIFHILLFFCRRGRSRHRWCCCWFNILMWHTHTRTHMHTDETAAKPKEECGRAIYLALVLANFKMNYIQNNNFLHPHARTHTYALVHTHTQYATAHNTYLIFSKWFSVNLCVHSTYTVLVMIFRKYTRGFNWKSVTHFSCASERVCACAFVCVEIIHRSINGLNIYGLVVHGLHNI